MSRFFPTFQLERKRSTGTSFFSWTGEKSFLFGGIFLFQSLERTFQSLQHASQSLECRYQSLKRKLTPKGKTFVQREKEKVRQGLEITLVQQ